VGHSAWFGAVALMAQRSKLVSEGRPTARGWWVLGAAAAAAVVFALIAVIVGVSVPLPDSAPGGQATEVLDAQGKLIGALRGEQRRQIVPMDQISKHLQMATVATEDRSFYEHSGVSYRGMVRALFTNVSAGQVEQGGSTLTQQYARNAFERVGTKRTIFRKLKEIALAKKIERRYPKDKILEFYLNTVYFGRGAYGAEAAAQTYFKKSAKDLDLGQAAYLAGVLRSPERFQFDKNPQGVVAIRNEVLGDMVREGYITQAEMVQVQGQNILSQFKLGPIKLDSARAGYFMEHIRRLLGTREYGFTEAEVLGGGLQIHTTLDLRMQQAAESAVSSTLNLPTDPEAALVAMDPEGRVKAMVGGRDVNDIVRARGFNFAANVRKGDGGGRQAGSAFKPFALAAFLEEGEPVTSRFPGPARITIQSPQCRNQDGSPWTVSNFDSSRFGTIDVVQATVNSVNTVYAQMMDKVVTPREFIRVAGEAGIPIPRRDMGCALTLGTTAVTPLEMARGFATFAARGRRPEPIMITRVVGPDGNVIKEQEPETEQTMDEEVADMVNYVLEQVLTRGTGTAAKIGRPAAGKTGTTQNHVDAWFAGYTPALSAVVWMGYPPDASGKIPQMNNVHGSRVTGGSFPAVIWRKFMQEALKGIRPEPFVKPKIGGDVVVPPPAPCPPGQVPGPGGVGCVGRAPLAPTPIELSPLEPIPVVPLPEEPPVSRPRRPVPSAIVPPSPSPGVSPSPSPSPVPSPSPSP
jgi:penicillin-binding protein 1A